MITKSLEGYLELKDVYVIVEDGKEYAFYSAQNKSKKDAVKVLSEDYIDFSKITTEQIDGIVYWKAPLFSKN